MDTLIAAVASLAGVVIGGGLSAWLQRRAEIRKILAEARGAVAQVTYAQIYPKSTGIDGCYDPTASDEMRERMHDEFVESLVAVRRALAALTPYCPDLPDKLGPQWWLVQSPDKAADVQEILKAGLRRALWKP